MGSRNFNVSDLGQGVFGVEAVKLEKGADDSGVCSTSSITPAPLSRQFWRAGNYDDKLTTKPAIQSMHLEYVLFYELYSMHSVITQLPYVHVCFAFCDLSFSI